MGVSPKPAFKPLFESAESKQGATVRLLEKRRPDSIESGDGLLWWRRGRVELPVQKTLNWNVLQACPALIFSLAASPPTKRLVSQPMGLLGLPASALGQTAPRIHCACSPPSGRDEGKRSRFRRLVRVVARELVSCRLFYEV